jgi:sulfur carrier protein ThiS
MRITVECFGILRDSASACSEFSAGAAAASADRPMRTVELPEDATIRALIRKLAIEPGLVAFATVGGAQRPLDHVLSDGDDVKLVPPVSGG